MAVQMKFRVDPKLTAKSIAALEAVKYGVRNRILKAALAKPARKAAKEERAHAPRGPTGVLKKSMGTRYKSYQQHTVWVYAAGPRAGFEATNPATGGRVVPTYYSHLAEGGRKANDALLAPYMRFALFKGHSMQKRGRKFSHWVYATHVRRAVGFYFAATAARSVVTGGKAVERDILIGIYNEAAKARVKGGSIFNP